MNEFFETEISKIYKLKRGDDSECRHYCTRWNVGLPNAKSCGSNGTLTVYVQDCPCCEPHDAHRTQDTALDWVKYKICRDCLDSVMEGLDCGGHYTNICIYDPITDFIDLKYKVNPSLVWYDSESEEA